MTCEEVELELSGGELSAVAKMHLAGCLECRETARVLGLAALPALRDSERLMLSSLPATVQREWREKKKPSNFAKRGLGYALAAGVGALVASGLMLKLHPATEVVETKDPSKVEAVALSDSNLSDDEVFFDVGWPSPTEGDL